MNELLTQIQDVYAAFSTDAALQIEKNNKAAGTRARKASLELEKLMKEFRSSLWKNPKNNFFFSVIFTCSYEISVCGKSLAGIS